MSVRGLPILPAKSRFAVLAVLALTIASSASAQAAGAPLRGKEPAAAPVAIASAKDPETTGSVQKAADMDANCAQSRKRLWVEGEGWVVRRVTICY